MKKLTICTGLAALALVVPAQAHKPDGAGSKNKSANSHSKRCTPKNVGYNARGVLVESSLTQSAGADTPTETGDDRYSGTVKVNVTRANHKGLKGEQTFTVTNVRVNFYDAAGDGTPDAPKAGDVVKLHGKVTRLNKRCDQTGFTSTVTVKRVQFKPAPTA